jgi:GNAT superfamily N-acetyltransferase
LGSPHDYPDGPETRRRDHTPPGDRFPTELLALRLTGELSAIQTRGGIDSRWSYDYRLSQFEREPMILVKPLTPNDSEAVQSLYDEVFREGQLPYGQRLPPDYLQSRVFESSLWETDCSLLATNRGRVSAVAVANLRCHPEESAGDFLPLNLLLVGSEPNDRRAATELLQTLAEKAAVHGKTKIGTSRQWAGLWPGLLLPQQQAAADACIAEGAHLEPGEVFLLLEPQQVIGLGSGDSSRCCGVWIRNYRAGDFDALHTVLERHFGIGWRYEVLSKVSLDYEPFNGYAITHPYAPEDLAVADTEDGLVGFCSVQTVTQGSWAFFGPIGLTPAFRNLGIGSLFLTWSCRRCLQRGKVLMGIWTNEPIYKGFYKGFGATPLFRAYHVSFELL